MDIYKASSIQRKYGSSPYTNSSCNDNGLSPIKIAGDFQPNNLYWILNRTNSDHRKLNKGKVRITDSITY
jgi:hypothetical protein